MIPIGTASPSTRAVVGSIPVGSNPVGVAVDAANGHVYVTNWGSNNVSVIATDFTSPPGRSGLAPVVLVAVVGAIAAVGVAAALIAWKRRKAGKPPPATPL